MLRIGRLKKSNIKMQKQTLSVVLATYNEENKLFDCLASVTGWCDEIVVVDGGSTDKTRDIAKNFNAKIIQTTNPAIFHINKQKAIDAAESNWILQLDADEQVTSALKQEIHQAITDKDANGFWIPRKNYFLGRFLMKGGVYPDYTLRLYRRGKGRLPQKDVHEQAIVEGTSKHLKEPLIHMADTTFSRYLQRNSRYSDLIAAEISKKNHLLSPMLFLTYIFFKPIYWFLLIYVRHKGFLDSWQGFIFAFFSGLKFPVAYIKAIRKYAQNRNY